VYEYFFFKKFDYRRSNLSIQIVGMSATLPNLNILAKWLDATLYHTDFRPVPLNEYLKIGKNVYNANNLSLSHTIEPSVEIKVMNHKLFYYLIRILLLYWMGFFYLILFF